MSAILMPRQNVLGAASHICRGVTMYDYLTAETEQYIGTVQLHRGFESKHFVLLAITRFSHAANVHIHSDWGFHINIIMY